ncbi:MAG: hypothetical protein FWE11_08215 [Defluviitaleaceae bacterium]|nr:hypothetical protein [Defluviitaleaceae bacterium]
MTTQFKYELKRLLLNKFYISLLIINGIFAWYVLSSDIILGVAFTAPFSSWSFGAYLASVMPMAILTTLFLLSFYYSKNEKQVEVLTMATPVNRVKYSLIRGTAVTLGFLLICIVAIALSIFFYATFFGYLDFAVFILPAIITIVPGFIFFMGLGSFAGRIHSGFLYALIPASFLMSFFQRPFILDIFGGGFYNNFPLTLPIGVDGEPAFMLSGAFIAVRVLLVIIGGILWAISLKSSLQGIKNQ